MTTIIQNFTLVSLNFTITPHQVWLPFEASGPLLDLCTRLFHLYTQLLLLCTRLLLTLRTQASMYKTGRIFCLGICRLSTCQGMRLDYPWALPSNKEWPVGWTQPDLFPCIDVGLVMCIGQGVLTRWQKSDTKKPC